MCTVLVLDDSPRQLAWIVEIVQNCFRGMGTVTLLPRTLSVNPGVQIRLPRRNDPIDDTRRDQWAAEALDGADVSEGDRIEIAIVDLCLTDPPQLRDPEGLWVCKAIRKRFPNCYIILVSSKTATDQLSITGGWFKYVAVPPVRIDEIVGIREDDAVSSRNQLASAIRKSMALQVQ